MTDRNRIIETPLGHFRLSYSSGHGTASRDTLDVAVRWRSMPEDLAGLTDVVCDPCTPEGQRYNGQDARPTIVVNRVEYDGTIYVIARGYHIGDSHPSGDNGWSLNGHYWTGEHMSRVGGSYHDKITDAALNKVKSYLADIVDEMLTDKRTVRDYWRDRFEDTAAYAIADARRDIEKANALLAWSRTYGGKIKDAPMPKPIKDKD